MQNVNQNTTQEKTLKPFERYVNTIKAGTVLIDKVIATVQLTQDSEFAYCPYCKERNQRAKGINWKDGLHKLWVNTHKQLLWFASKEEILSRNAKSTEARVCFEKKFFCDTCKKDITEDDFLKCRKASFQNKIIPDIRLIPYDDPEFIANF